MLIPLLSKQTNKRLNLLFFLDASYTSRWNLWPTWKVPAHEFTHTCSGVCFFRDFCPIRIMDVWVSTVLWGPRGSSSTADTVASRGRRAPTQTSDDGPKKTIIIIMQHALFYHIASWTHSKHNFSNVLRMLPFCGFNLFSRFPVLNCYYCFDP